MVLFSVDQVVAFISQLVNVIWRCVWRESLKCLFKTWASLWPQIAGS